MSRGNSKNKHSEKQRAKRRRVPRTPRLEPLESRWLRAGNVLASVVHGNLIITEDPLTAGTDNQIQVDQIGVPPGTFNIVGGGTTTVNGGAAATLPGVVKGVIIDLNGGDDQLTVTTSLIGGNLTIDMGDGDNTALITATTVRRNVTVIGGAGRDDVGILGSTIGSNVVIDSGDGDNRNDIGGDFDFLSTTTAIHPVRIRGGLRVEGGIDSDDVSIQNTTISKDAALHLGDGDNDVTISGITRIAGQLEESGGIGPDKVLLGRSFGDVSDTRIEGIASFNLGGGANDVLINKMTLSRGLSVFTQDGDDDVTISNSIIGGEAVLNLAGGDNRVRIYTNFELEFGIVTTTIRGVLTINTNDGDDQVTITSTELLRGANLSLGGGDNSTFIESTRSGGALNYGGGIGSDDLQMFDTTIQGHATLALGAGDNDVTINSSTILQNFNVIGGADADDLFLETVTVGGITTLMTVAGDDLIQINDSIFQNRFNLKAGDGDDTVLVENLAGTATATAFVGQAQFLLGRGDDFLQLGFAADATRLARFENVTKNDVLDGGDGTDDLDENNATYAFGTSPKKKNFEA